MRMTVGTALALAVVLGGIGGCGGRGSSGSRGRPSTGGGAAEAAAPVHSFPTEAEIQHLVATAPPPALAMDDSIRPAAWALGPIALEETGIADAVAAAAAEGRTATTSAAARCAARELARFLAVNGGVPDPNTRMDMAAICGMATTGVALAGRRFSGVGSRVTDESIVAEAVSAVAEDLVAGLGGTTAAIDVGAAIFREGGAGAVAAIAGISAIRLDPGAIVPGADGHVRFSGERITAGSQLTALTNLGPAGVAHCDVASDGSARFLVDCPSEAADPIARIDLVAAEHDGVLLLPAGSVYAVRDPAATLEVGRGTAEPVPASAETFAVAVAGLLDERRVAVGLSPLTHAVLQSAANRDLVAYVAGPPGDARDLASLAAIAGYGVDGLIRIGRMTMSTELGTNDARRWLDHVLATPLGRWSLYSPDARAVAFGAESDGTSLAAIATTYAFFEGTPSTDADTAAAVLTAERTSRGLSPAVRVTEVPGMEEALTRVGRGERSPAAALDDVLRAISARGRSVRGWAGATSSLDDVPFPTELTASFDAPVFGIGVVAYRAPGGAWGQYAILIIQFV